MFDSLSRRYLLDSCRSIWYRAWSSHRVSCQSRSLWGRRKERSRENQHQSNQNFDTIVGSWYRCIEWLERSWLPGSFRIFFTAADIDHLCCVLEVDWIVRLLKLCLIILVEKYHNHYWKKKENPAIWDPMKMSETVLISISKLVYYKQCYEMILKTG